MTTISGLKARVGEKFGGRSKWLRAALLATCLLLATRVALASEPNKAAPGTSSAGIDFPTVPARHTQVRALLENAMKYVAAGNGMVDTVSGYPFEGWNHDPKQGLFLRSFTQLTAIGLYMELLANVVAGSADTPGLARDQALAQLTRLVASLRADQRDPRLGARGLLVNFLDLATGKRLGPLASDVDKSAILDAFGPDRGEVIWKALQAKGWITPRNQGREGAIQRSGTYGAEHFDGPLSPYADEATKRRLMEILDQRVVLVVFGDNANLSASAARSIGALLDPSIADRPEVAALRRELGRFLDDQREGYARLYDAKTGLFDFGWDATRDRLFGWEDLQGRWTIGHMDYFVNEFRGPATFVAARFGLPAEAIGNLGFKIKPYRVRDGSDIYTLAPWEGSAFQALGLVLSLSERERPSWRALLGNAVDIEVDYAARHHLPGFLSESYTGEGARYTGDVGIPAITVSPRPRVTDAASLYCLGAAYTIAPEKVERFLEANWSLVSTLLTDHGPWEGYNVTRREPIRFQTSAHTLALILGLLGTGPDHMNRFARRDGCEGRLDEAFRPGVGANLLAEGTQIFAWTGKGGHVQGARRGSGFHVVGNQAGLLGVAFVPSRGEGINLSGTRLILRYRSVGPMDPVHIALKPKDAAGLIAKEIFTQFESTGGQEKEIQVVLPAMAGLARVKEVVITHERGAKSEPVDLSVTRLEFQPMPPAGAAR